MFTYLVFENDICAIFFASKNLALNEKKSKRKNIVDVEDFAAS